jgi:dihydropteroate synthase
LIIERVPLVMGILNVTPDSFSDGGKHHDVASAVAAALDMQVHGAAIIDIGGESTRPYSDPVAVDEELDRVLPVIEALRGKLTIPISIDTSKAKVAAAAIEAGAEIINDVTGLEGDPEMVDVAKQSEVGVCVMHMQGTPQTMQDDPRYDNVVDDILRYLEARYQDCLGKGIAAERICLDPGIGFGKTHAHNVELLQYADKFCQLQAPILIGHSRKGFVGKLIGDKSADRDIGTLAVSLAVAAAGADILRVHNVEITTQALRIFDACGGLGSYPTPIFK